MSTEVRLQEVLDDSSISDSLKALLRIMDVKLEVLMEERTKKNKDTANLRKVVNSIDDCVAEMSEELEHFKDVFRKEILNSPNLENPIESSFEYQEEQGLIEREPDMDNPTLEDGETLIFVLTDPVADKYFQEGFKYLNQLAPGLTPAKLYGFLSQYF